MRINFAVLVILVAFLCTGACDKSTSEELSCFTKLDVLFVIDNSNSMTEEQQKVRDQVSELVNLLLTTTPITSVHVGVVTTEGPWDDPNHSAGVDPGETLACDYTSATAGILKLTNEGGGACPVTESGFTFREPDKNFLTFDVGGDQATFADEVECIIAQGTGGCGIEQPLNAMYYAIDKTDSGEANAGFIRDDALLAVIMVTDEDDCSAPADSWLFDNRAYIAPSMPASLTGNPFHLDYPYASIGGLIQYNQICAIVSEANSGDATLILPVTHFRDKLIAAKHGHENRVVFATITGTPDPSLANVPDNLLDDPAALLDFDECDADQCDPAGASPGCSATASDFDGDKPTMKYYDSQDECQSAPVEPACKQGSDTLALPGRRLVQFAKALSDAGVGAQIETICATDYAAAITDIASKIGVVVGDECGDSP